MTACITGCTTHSRHHPSCQDSDCCGCLPRLAMPNALICGRCHGRTSDALNRAADLVAAIRDQVGPGAAPGGSDIHSPYGPRTPLNTSAVADADDLHALLAAWVDLHIADHGALTAPDITGSVVARATSTLTAAGERVYLPARVVGTRGDWHTTLHLTRWLRTHLDWAATRPWAAEYVAELTTTVHRLTVCYPSTEQPRYLPTPCPACRTPSLIRFAPTVYQGPITIVCADCGEPVPEPIYTAHTRTLYTEHAKRGQRT